MKIEHAIPAAAEEQIVVPAALETPPAAAPVETPAPAAPPTEEVSAGSEALDWGQLNEDLDTEQVIDAGEEVVPPVTPPIEEPAPVIPPKSEVIPPETPTSEVVPSEVTPPPTPEETAVPTVPPVPPVAEPPTPEVPPVVPVPTETPEQQAEALQKVRTEQHSKLTDFYKLSDEDAASMITSPQEVVPNMLANLHMTVLENTLQTLASMIPQMVSQVMETKKANENANEAFFGAWPKLAKAELYAPLGRMISAYRTANPEVPQDQLIKEVGAAAHLAFKIAPDEMPGVGGIVPNPGVSPEGLPVAPAVPGSGFTPAAPGGSTPPAPVKSNNPWDSYNKELDKEEAHGQFQDSFGVNSNGFCRTTRYG